MLYRAWTSSSDSFSRSERAIVSQCLTLCILLVGSTTWLNPKFWGNFSKHTTLYTQIAENPYVQRLEGQCRVALTPHSLLTHPSLTSTTMMDRAFIDDEPSVCRWRTKRTTMTNQAYDGDELSVRRWRTKRTTMTEKESATVGFTVRYWRTNCPLIADSWVAYYARWWSLVSLKKKVLNARKFTCFFDEKIWKSSFFFVSLQLHSRCKTRTKSTPWKTRSLTIFY